jgi:hypothetical protein
VGVAYVQGVRFGYHRVRFLEHDRAVDRDTQQAGCQSAQGCEERTRIGALSSKRAEWQQFCKAWQDTETMKYTNYEFYRKITRKLLHMRIKRI